LRLFGVIGLALSLTAIAPGGGREAMAADKLIRLALQPAPLLGYYLRDKQLLEKRGYKTEWNVFPFTPPILEAMAGGSLDIAFLGVGPVLSTAMRNPGIWYFYDELANAAGMVVRADSGINGPLDLKGKKIAFPGKASQLYAQLLMYLGDSGVKEGDIDLVRANATDMTTLFQRKEVVGMLCWPPFTSELVRTGEAKSLYNADDLLKAKVGHWLNSGWGVRSDYARQNPDAVIAVIEALHEATQALRKDPEAVYQAFAAGTGYSLDAIRFIVEQKYDVYFDPKDTAPSVDNMTRIFEVFEKYGILKADKPVGPVIQSLVHPEFVEQVLAKSR
jgi:sulfonate transport system substrate-binding protein